jgi:hypothetical protein
MKYVNNIGFTNPREDGRGELCCNRLNIHGSDNLTIGRINNNIIFQPFYIENVFEEDLKKFPIRFNIDKIIFYFLYLVIVTLCFNKRK